MELVVWLFFGVYIVIMLITKIVLIFGKEEYPVPVRYHDGGRRRAGFKGITGDCVTRAIAIATGHPYGAVYSLVDRALKKYAGPREHPGRGVVGWMAEGLMEAFGGVLHEVPPGTYLRPDTIPYGTIVVWLKGHTVAVIDKVAYDTFEDPTRREMIGYWVFPDRRSKR